MISYPFLALIGLFIYGALVKTTQKKEMHIFFMLSIIMGLAAYLNDPNYKVSGDIVRYYQKIDFLIEMGIVENLKVIFNDVWSATEIVFYFITYIIQKFNLNKQIFSFVHIFILFQCFFIMIKELKRTVYLKKQWLLFVLLLFFIWINPMRLFNGYRSITSYFLIVLGIIKINNRKKEGILYLLSSVFFHSSSLLIVIIYYLSKIKRKVNIYKVWFLGIIMSLLSAKFISIFYSLPWIGELIKKKGKSYLQAFYFHGNVKIDMVLYIFYALLLIISMTYIYMHKKKVKFTKFLIIRDFLEVYVFFILMFFPYVTLFTRFIMPLPFFCIPILLEVLFAKNISKKTRILLITITIVLINPSYIFVTHNTIAKGFPSFIFMNIKEIVNYKIHL